MPENVTARGGLPYPSPGQHARTWEYWQALAERVAVLIGTPRMSTLERDALEGDDLFDGREIFNTDTGRPNVYDADANAGAGAWLDPIFNATTAIGARVLLSSSREVPHNTATSIDFDSAALDSDGFWSAGTADRLTVPTGLGGVYRVSGLVCFASDNTADRAATIESSQGRLSSTFVGANPRSVTRIGVVADFVELDDGDWVELDAFHFSGDPLNVQGSAANPTHLALTRIGGTP